MIPTYADDLKRPEDAALFAATSREAKETLRIRPHHDRAVDR
jgi:hypothetical protein